MDIKGRNEKVRLRKQKKGLGSVQRTILLLLLGGIALSCTRSNKKQWSIIKGIYGELKEIRRQAAERAIEALYESRLVEARENPDGTHTIVLSEKGRQKSLTYRIHSMKIKPQAKWDGKWRLVTYDIPEDEREVRDAFRNHLKRLGLRKLQHSVSVTPLNCKKEIEFISELLDIRKHVRFIIAEHIDNEPHLKKIFKLEPR